jgi:P-type Mg2+ transporter
MMLFVFDSWTNPSLFQTGWFVESLLTQTLIIHIIRTAKIPFVQSRASPALIGTTIIISLVGIALPFTVAGAALGITPLPALYWPLVATMLLTYSALTHLVKVSSAGGGCDCASKRRRAGTQTTRFSARASAQYPARFGRESPCP